MQHSKAAGLSSQFVDVARKSLLAFVVCVCSCAERRPVSSPSLAFLRGLGIDLEVVTLPRTTGAGKTMIRLGVPSAGDVKSFLPVLEREIRFYPHEALEKIGCKRIVLCQDLRTGNSDNLAFATCVPSAGVIYIDVSKMRLTDRAGPRTIHHEMYHLIDYYLGHLTDGITWNSIDGGPTVCASDMKSSMKSGEAFGFVSSRAALSAAEDRAEIFSMLMADHVLLEYYAGRDPVLRNKVEQTKLRIQELSTNCNEAFWSRLHEERMNDPLYSKYTDQVLQKLPVYLVSSSDALKQIAAGNRQNVDVRALESTLSGPDLNILYTQSVLHGHRPFCEIIGVKGQGMSTYLLMSGFVMAEGAVPAAFLKEALGAEHVQRPILLDLIYDVGSAGGQDALFVAVRRADTK